MLSIITNRFGAKPNGQPRTIDLHEVKVPGGKRATQYNSQELFNECKRLGVDDIAITQGWQDLCLRLGAHLQRIEEAKEAAS